MTMKKKTHGNNIRGSIKPFNDKTFLDLYRDINSSVYVYPDDLERLCEMSKDMIAQRMRVTMCSKCKIKKISIESIEIIANCLQGFANEHIYGFVSCTIRYYNSEREHIVRLNKNCSSCTSRDFDKSFKHAYKDCKKFYSFYMDKVCKKIKNGDLRDIDNHLMLRYSAIESAIEFFSEYVYKYHMEYLPQTMSPTLFEGAVNFDARLSKYYKFSECENIYYLKAEKNYNKVTQECATYILSNLLVSDIQ